MAVVPSLVGITHSKTERLRPLAYSGAKRLPALPDLPTTSEAGLSGCHLDTGWHAWIAPAKTPDAIVQRVYAVIKKSLDVPLDIKRWGEIVKIAGITPE